MNWKRGLFRLWVVNVPWLILVMASTLAQGEFRVKKIKKEDLIALDRRGNREMFPSDMLTKNGDLIADFSASVGVRLRRKDGGDIRFQHENWWFNCDPRPEDPFFNGYLLYDLNMTTCSLRRDIYSCFEGEKHLEIDRQEYRLSTNPEPLYPPLSIVDYASSNNTMVMKFKMIGGHIDMGNAEVTARMEFGGVLSGGREILLPPQLQRLQPKLYPKLILRKFSASFTMNDMNFKTGKSTLVDYEYVATELDDNPESNVMDIYYTEIPCKIRSYGIRKPLATETPKAR